MDSIIESFQQRNAMARHTLEGEVAGIAMPFDTSDERPGLWFGDESESGGLTFFEYTTYAPQSFDVQLSLPDWGGRVRFMWSHGLEAGMTSIPIGNVTELRATPEAVMFRAQLGETDVAGELRKVLAAGSVKETSVMLEIADFTFEEDEDGKTFRRVTSAQLFDVSLVAHGQFPQARLLEVHSHEANAHCSGLYCAAPVSQDEPKPPDADVPIEISRSSKSGVVTISKAALGQLYAHIERLQHAERTRFAKEVATKC